MDHAAVNRAAIGTTTGLKLANAVSLYVDGVVGGDLNAVVDKYVTRHMIEHTPGLAQGRSGILDVFEPLIRRFDRRFIRPLRGFEDCGSVVVQTFQSFGYRELERVVFDVFDTDGDDRLVEHWSVTTALAPISTSGFSQIDGPTVIADLDATAANKRLVAAYTADVLIARHFHQVSRYRTPAFIDHHPLVDRVHTTRHGHAPSRATYLRMVRLLGHGNYVTVLGDVAVGGKPAVVCDLYRVQDGAIAEHWDAVQPAPSRAVPAMYSGPVARVPGGQSLERYGLPTPLGAP
jgi:predicted SnoaL-like aldol condensation-catalyzing enzyme